MRPFPDPSILLHPQIPKPLHLMAPRVFLGDEWWNSVRRETYWRHGYRCHSCGIPGDKAEYRRGLEAHEMYDINYTTGRVVFVEVVALCHYCHNYIHMGRLEALYSKGEIASKLFYAIVRHGKLLLQEAGIPADVNEQLLEMLRELGLTCTWEDYHMVINGVSYGRRFKSYREWVDYWNQ